MKPPIALLLLILCSNLYAQETEKKIKPICKVHVTTMNENKMKGLLLLTKDSTLAIYPGKTTQWNKGKKYNAVVFDYTRIKKITIKKNNRVVKGMVIGTVIGSLPLLAAGRPDDKSGIAQLSQLTVPIGMITGTVVGLTAQKTYPIGGSFILFYEFQKQIR